MATLACGQLDGNRACRALRTAGATGDGELEPDPGRRCDQPYAHGQGDGQLEVPGAGMQRSRVRRLLGRFDGGGGACSVVRAHAAGPGRQRDGGLCGQLERRGRGGPLPAAGAQGRRSMGCTAEHVGPDLQRAVERPGHVRLSRQGMQRRRLCRLVRDTEHDGLCAAACGAGAGGAHLPGAPSFRLSGAVVIRGRDGPLRAA